MIPRLLEIGPLPINSFGLCIALAAWGGILMLTASFQKNGIDPKLGEKYALWGVISGLLGARVWSLLHRIDDVMRDPIGEIFSGAGFIFYGGFITATVVLLLLCKKDNIKFSTFVDSLGPTLCLGYAIGRVGCQLSGDGDYGVVTDSIFGMSYKTGVIPTAGELLAWPTPIFESMMALGICFFLLKLESLQKWKNIPYARFGAYLSLMSLERFIIEFFRRNPRLEFGLSEAQFISLGLMVIGVLFLLINSRTAKVT